MKISKLSAISAICIIMISSSFTIITSANDIELSSDLPDHHTIQDVPYVGVETGFDCEYASLSMLIQYLDLNYSYHDLFYLMGGAYTLASRPKLQLMEGTTNILKVSYPPWPWYSSPKLHLDSGSLTCFWEKDFDFISQIMGVNFNITYEEENSNPEQDWQNYWQRCKNYIVNDIPVWTACDGCAIPWWREHLPEVQGSYERGLPGPSVHVIVLVGYNEANQTVCYHDMMNSNYSKLEAVNPGEYIWKGNETCEYMWMNISDLKDGVINDANQYWYDDYKLITMVLEKVDEPLPKSEAFELARSRNIKKIQGWNEEVYDRIYLDFYNEFAMDD